MSARGREGGTHTKGKGPHCGKVTKLLQAQSWCDGWKMDDGEGPGEWKHATIDGASCPRPLCLLVRAG